MCVCDGDKEDEERMVVHLLRCVCVRLWYMCILMYVCVNDCLTAVEKN